MPKYYSIHVQPKTPDKKRHTSRMRKTGMTFITGNLRTAGLLQKLYPKNEFRRAVKKVFSW